MDDPKILYPPFGAQRGLTRLQRLETGAQRLQRGQIRPTSGAYTRIPIQSLHTKPNSVQIVDLSKSQIRKIGGTSINASTAGFAYTSTIVTITWYWDGTNGSRVPVITRADGTKQTIPTSGSPLLVKDLAPNTTYYFLPFWNVDNLCNIGWVQGTTGTPQIAFTAADTVDPVNNPIYLMQQTFQGNEPLTSGYMSAATPAIGTGGGGGGAGGGGSAACVRSGTRIATLGDIPYECQVLEETEWVYLETERGKELFCTYDHPLYHALKGKVPADSLTAGDWVITEEGEQLLVTVEFTTKKCSKYKISMERGHLFFANGFLSHNIKPVSSL